MSKRRYGLCNHPDSDRKLGSECPGMAYCPWTFLVEDDKLCEYIKPKQRRRNHAKTVRA